MSHQELHIAIQQAVDRSGLNSVLDILYTHFNCRFTEEDLKILAFHLQYLFSKADILYSYLFPELAQATNTENQLLELKTRYTIWSWLYEIRNLLESIEPSCHSLNDVVLSMLALLDRTCSVVEHQFHLPTTQQIGYLDEQFSCPTVEQERWNNAVEQLAEHLKAWQNYTQPSFSTQFTNSLTRALPLHQLDIHLRQLLPNTCAIFNDILPGLQATSAGDDEAVVALLFDLAQKIDLWLLHIAALLDPLHALLKMYAPGVEIY